MPTTRTPQRVLTTTIGVPKAGDGITDTLFIQQWLSKLQDTGYYLSEELKTVSSIDIRTTDSLSNILTHLVRLTAPGLTETKPTVTLTFATPNSPLGSHRIVRVERMSPKTTLSFHGDGGEFHSYTASRHETGLTFLIVHDGSGWVVWGQLSDNQEAPIVHKYINGAGGIAETNVRARFIHLNTSNTPLQGGNSLQFAAAVAFPASIPRLHAVFVDKINAGGALALKDSVGTEFYSYAAKKAQTNVVFWVTLDSDAGGRVIGVSQDQNQAEATENLGSTGSRVVPSGVRATRVSDLNSSPAQFTLPDAWEGAEYDLSVGTVTNGQSVRIASSTKQCCSYTNNSGQNVNDVNLRVIYAGGGWQNGNGPLKDVVSS